MSTSLGPEQSPSFPKLPEKFRQFSQKVVLQHYVNSV